VGTKALPDDNYTTEQVEAILDQAVGDGLLDQALDRAVDNLCAILAASPNMPPQTKHRVLSLFSWMRQGQAEQAREAQP
jgi:hypothetical protein